MFCQTLRSGKTLLMMIPAVNLKSTLHRNPNNVLYRVTHCVVQECNCDWRQGRAGLCLVRGFRGFRMSAPVLLWCLNCHLHAPRSFSFSLVSARIATKTSTIVTSSFSQTRTSFFIFKKKSSFSHFYSLNTLIIVNF